MVVYVAVIAVVALMLVVSYRALAGGQLLGEADYRVVLERLSEFTRTRAGELGAALAASDVGSEQEDILTAAAIEIRKKLSSYQQQLGMFDTGVGEDLDAACYVLSTAIEDLGWACRMIEPGTYRTNPGIRAAVATLREHAEDCLPQNLPERLRSATQGGIK